jgi:hypothetical protein
VVILPAMAIAAAVGAAAAACDPNPEPAAQARAVAVGIVEADNASALERVLERPAFTRCGAASATARAVA